LTAATSHRALGRERVVSSCRWRVVLSDGIAGLRRRCLSLRLVVCEGRSGPQGPCDVGEAEDHSHPIAPQRHDDDEACSYEDPSGDGRLEEDGELAARSDEVVASESQDEQAEHPDPWFVSRRDAEHAGKDVGDDDQGHPDGDKVEAKKMDGTGRGDMGSSRGWLPKCNGPLRQRRWLPLGAAGCVNPHGPNGWFRHGGR
jgi:hypothetical protein